MPARLEHANLTVPDIDAAVAFLRTLEPAMAVMHDSAAAGTYRWVHIGVGDSYLALEEPHASAPEAGRARRYADYGVNHLGFVVDDIAACATRLLTAGYRETHRAEVTPARVRRYFLDAAGFEWELVQYLTEDRAARFSYG